MYGDSSFGGLSYGDVLITHSVDDEVEYWGDGQSLTFPVPFAYSDVAYIYAFINDILTTDYFFSTPQTITFSTPPQKNVVIKIALLSDNTDESGTVLVPIANANTPYTTKISDNDEVGRFLKDKLVAGANVSLVEQYDGDDEKLQINCVPFNATDEKLKVSSNDFNSGYLKDKISAGYGVTITEQNDGGPETLQIDCSLAIPTNKNFQVFTSSGNFTPPTGITEVLVLLVGGGGGGGGGCQGSWSCGGQGGAKGRTLLRRVAVTPLTPVSVVVGNGGGFGINQMFNDGQAGGAGGTSSFGALTASGGAGGPGGWYNDGANNAASTAGAESKWFEGAGAAGGGSATDFGCSGGGGNAGGNGGVGYQGVCIVWW